MTPEPFAGKLVKLTMPEPDAGACGTQGGGVAHLMIRELIAGVDIGGTKIALALSDAEGRIVSSRRFATRVERGPHEIVSEAIAEIGRMAAETSARVVAAGVGCGGPLDRRLGLILSPPNLPGWDEFPIVEMLGERLGVPVVLDNDANAAALGENLYGAGRGMSDLVYLTISTGIGGGIIAGGRLVYGVYDGAGEFGHMTVLPGGPPCGCGARGCLEALCSGTGIARRARERLADGAQSSMAELAGGAERVTAATVAEAARAGDPLAAEIWDETIRHLAVGVGNVVVALAPEAVILGGGVSTAGEQLFGPLRRLVRERVRMLPPEHVRVLQAELGGDSGLRGALVLGLRALEQSRAG